ncbi:hypothetical protein HXX76_015388 [Chlamydomonas incerta]|uniref:Protein kinase domain-containing protein n=1 Tax=Chlamydomonas incerta TaxID=51695 RepID=A0A835VPW0_CHLIN|nr:hypothetical protein HXX76_015388 [Chlamydomonas incerta]|eukprot:KAG2423340.1 hypothetical protein HXX76_015388 [Chlamydomonas incerta]
MPGAEAETQLAVKATGGALSTGGLPNSAVPAAATAASAAAGGRNALLPDTPQTAPMAAAITARAANQLLLAAWQRDLGAEQVVECNPAFILEGLELSQQQLGRGSFGIVVCGAYHGLLCAVKVMVTDSLDSSALSELLLAPIICNHANLVQTYTSRCATLTHGFFDWLEGGGGRLTSPAGAQARDSRLPPRLLRPIANMQSGDGFGDPGCGIASAPNPVTVLHALLYECKATVGQRLLVLVQELCNKSTLHNAIRRGTFKLNPHVWTLRLARRALLRTAVEVARGLLHLHEMGVVHGDVKPANVLLASSRDDRRGFNAKVADFGLARVLPLVADGVHGRSNGYRGSPAYMAPEAFRGCVSRASDVWSFGVCLHEMLTGVRPFSDVPATDTTALMAAIREGRVRLVWPNERRTEMAEGIIAIGKRCMSPQPEDRPGFREIIEELVNTERIIRAEALAPVVTEKVAAQQAAEEEALAGLTPQQRSTRLAETLASMGIPPDIIRAIFPGCGDAA